MLNELVLGKISALSSFQSDLALKNTELVSPAMRVSSSRNM